MNILLKSAIRAAALFLHWATRSIGLKSFDRLAPLAAGGGRVKAPSKSLTGRSRCLLCLMGVKKEAGRGRITFYY
jgi:hypothetical protein